MGRRHSLVWILILVLSGCGVSSPAAPSPAASPPSSGQVTVLPTADAEALVPATSTPPVPRATAAPTAAPTREATPSVPPLAVPDPAGLPTLVYLQANTENTAIEVLALDGASEPRLIQVLPCARFCEGRRWMRRVPGERAIAVVTEQQSYTGPLQIINIDTGAAVVVAEDVSSLTPVAFSPDGSQVAFVRLRDASPAPVQASSIWAVNRATGEDYQVTEWAFFQEALYWHDSDELLFSQARIGTPPARWATWRVLMSDDQPQSLVSDGKIAGLFADRSAFMAILETGPLETEPDGALREGYAIGMIPLSTTQAVTLTSNNADEYRHAVLMSPDRRRSALFDMQSGTVVILESAAGVPQQIAELQLPSDAFLGWDARGERLFYQQADSLLAVAVATGQVTPVMQLQWQHPGSFRLPDWDSVIIVE